ncbi:DUF1372 family protein [Streptococcus suis]|nr:DUF1372 family protein [Streptococcus suis]
MKQAIKFVMVMLVLTFAISMSAIYKLQKQVEQLEARKPVIIYQVDNAGGDLIGTVTEKAIVDGHYTVTVGAYGKFLVTKKQYDSINVGDDAPDYLKQRGS